MPNFSDIPVNINQLISQHIKLYLEHPEQAHMWDATPVGTPKVVPTLLLTTKGRRSGKERHVPLLYVDDQGGYVVIGSKGGDPEDPLWYRNLQAEPLCEIRVGKLRTAARARTLEGAEREQTWGKVTATHPVYEKYQARTGRQIPLVRLEPTGS